MSDMGDDMLFEGFAAAYPEEDLRSITGDFSIDETAPAIMPEGVPDIWQQDFNNRSMQDALTELIRIQESEFRFEVGPVNEATTNPATPVSNIKGSPRFPGHLSMMHTSLEATTSLSNGTETPGLTSFGRHGQLTPFPRLFSGGKLHKNLTSTPKQPRMGGYGESPLKRPVFPARDDAEGSDEEEARIVYDDDNPNASHDDASLKKTKSDIQQGHTNATTPVNEEPLASFTSQVKLEEKKLASLKDEIKQQEQIKAEKLTSLENEIKRQQQIKVAIEQETQRIKHDRDATLAEAAHTEDQRILKETQVQLQAQARVDAEELKHATELRDLHTCLDAERVKHTNELQDLQTLLDAGRVKHTNELRDLQNQLDAERGKHTNELRDLQTRLDAERVKHTRELRDLKLLLQDAESSRGEAMKELRALIKASREAQEQAARDQAPSEAAGIEERNRVHTWDDADVRRRRQESEDARLAARLQQEMDEHPHSQQRGRTDYDKTQELEDDRMVARFGKELSTLLRDTNSIDEREMAEVEFHQNAQVAAYESHVAAYYDRQNEEHAKQTARLQYSSHLAAEGRARLHRDALVPSQAPPPHPSQSASTPRNVGSTIAQYQPQPPAQRHSNEPVPVSARFEDRGPYAQDRFLQSNPSMGHQTIPAFQDHHDALNSGLQESFQDAAPTRHSESLPIHQPDPATIPAIQEDNPRTRQAAPARVTEVRAPAPRGPMISANAARARQPVPVRTTEGRALTLREDVPIKVVHAQQFCAPVHSISSSENDDLLDPLTATSEISFVSSNTDVEEIVYNGNLMPPYDIDSRAVRLKSSNGQRAWWSVSEAPYPLSPIHLQVEGAESGHLHFHTDTLHSRANAWMLTSSGIWDNVTKQWRTDWSYNSEPDMLAHPRYEKLVLTVSNDNKPNWIQFGTFKNKLKDGSARKAKMAADGFVLFPVVG